MATKRKLVWVTPSTEDERRSWRLKNWAQDELAFLFLVEALVLGAQLGYTDSDIQMRIDEYPDSATYGIFDWSISDQQWCFWYLKANEAARGLKKYVKQPKNNKRMAKIQKLKTRKPTPEELKNYVRVQFDPEALFILFCLETWRQDWNEKWSVPLFVASGFSWSLSEQGWLFWFQKSKKTLAALKKYRP